MLYYPLVTGPVFWLIHASKLQFTVECWGRFNIQSGLEVKQISPSLTFPPCKKLQPHPRLPELSLPSSARLLVSCGANKKNKRRPSICVYQVCAPLLVTCKREMHPGAPRDSLGNCSLRKITLKISSLSLAVPGSQQKNATDRSETCKTAQSSRKSPSWTPEFWDDLPVNWVHAL